MYSIALLSQILKLCNHHINYQEQGVFRLGANDKTFLALKETLLTDVFLNKTNKQDCVDVWDDMSKLERLKGLTFDSHDWASLAKHTFMNALVLNPDDLQAAATWKALNSKLKTIFAQIYLNYSMTHPGHEQEAFNSIDDKMKKLIQKSFLKFLAQLYLSQQLMSFNVIIDFLSMATLADSQQNGMDATAIGVVFAPSILHALNLQEAFLSKPDNWLEATANQKLEYQFMACVVSSILEIPKIGDRKSMVDLALSTSLNEKHQYELDQLRAKIWQKKPMHLSTKQVRSKSKKTKKADKNRSTTNLSLHESEPDSGSEESIDLTKTLEKLSLSPSKQKKKKASKHKADKQPEATHSSQAPVLHQFESGSKPEKLKRSKSERSVRKGKVNRITQ